MPESKSSTTYTFTYHDPSKTFDGSPYQAAGKSILQVDAVLKLLQRSLLDANIQARNAYMQRNLDLGDDPNAIGWEDQPEARIIAKIVHDTGTLRKRLPAVMKAAAYDPKNPPKEEDE